MPRRSALVPLLVLLAPPVCARINVEAAGTVRQGEVLRIAAHEAAGDLEATLAGKTIRLFPGGDGEAVGLMPVNALQEPGTFPLIVKSTGGEELFRRDVNIEDAGFEKQDIKTSRNMRGLSAKPEEVKLMQKFNSTVSDRRFWVEPFARPTPDCMNSPFGVQRLHDGKPSGNYHRGLDLRSPAGRPIRATAAGKVMIARRMAMPGNIVGIDHGQGLLTAYLHMSRIAVKEGAMVKRGQIIGYVGSTGFATGPHLHWSMVANGVAVTPLQWAPEIKACAARAAGTKP